MNSLERRSVGWLASIYALRMAGLFLVLPVFVLYAHGLRGETPLLVGLALGAYGLSQAVLQIPFGVISDHIGRKPVIIVGLIIFAIGSAVAATSTSIWGIMIGRAIQGAGAFAAVIMAMVADLTREEQRSKAMAIIGMTIGASFVLSLIIGPLLNGVIGVPGIFWLTSVLALFAIGVVIFWVPTPVRNPVRKDRAIGKEFRQILRDTQLLRMDAGIFFLHLVMTAMFVVLPQTIVRYLGLPASRHWELYLPVMLVGFVAMLPFLMLANRKRRTKPVLAGAIVVLIGSQITLMFQYRNAFGLILGLWLFFASFSLLEAMLPSLISRLSPVGSKGAAIGVYNSMQFLGAFTGGAVGGGISGAFGFSGVFVTTAALLLVWLILVLTMTEPHFLSTRQIRVGEQTPADAENLARKLSDIPGVAEAIVIPEEGVAYLKVDNRVLDEKHLEAFAAVS